MAQDVPRATAIQQAAMQVLQEPNGPAERILVALLGMNDGDEFDVSILDALTPETIMRLDMLAGEVIDFGRADDLANAVAAALIKRTH